MESFIDKNNQNIDSLKAEIEKRNPTQVEKLSLRVKDSYPFSITPDEYWRDKEATSNYSTEDDNDEEVSQYTITQNDIASDTDWRAISKSLDNDDSELRQNLGSILNY
jgi:hypothetical protein